MGMLLSKKEEGGTKKKTFDLDELKEHDKGINTMALSEDGSVLATGSDDCTVRLWTTKTEKCECIGVLNGHEDYVNTVVIEESYVITGSADKTIRKWDMSTCECVKVFHGHKSLINRIISTGDFIFSSSYDRTARCWDFDTGQCIRVFTGHKRGVYPMAFVPVDDDDETGECRDVLITGSADFTAISWSFETGKPIKTFKEHSGAITCMATDSNGRILLTGSTDHTVRSWNIQRGDRLKIFEGHQSSIICLTVINRMIYTGSADLTARSWVIEFGDCTRVYRGHGHSVSCIKFSDGFVYTGSGDGLVLCFDAKSGSLKRTFKGHGVAVNALQVLGGKLFSGAHDGSLRVWDITGLTTDTAFGREKEPIPKVADTTQRNNQANQQNRAAAPERNKIVIGDENMNDSNY